MNTIKNTSFEGHVAKKVRIRERDKDPPPLAPGVPNNPPSYSAVVSGLSDPGSGGRDLEWPEERKGTFQSSKENMVWDLNCRTHDQSTSTLPDRCNEDPFDDTRQQDLGPWMKLQRRQRQRQPQPLPASYRQVKTNTFSQTGLQGLRFTALTDLELLDSPMATTQRTEIAPHLDSYVMQSKTKGKAKTPNQTNTREPCTKRASFNPSYETSMSSLPQTTSHATYPPKQVNHPITRPA
ncbi:hypothetical protein K2173_022205 [Erythroxylum novogranatense]|uniref:Uncharacterized protein n=1 Tax=Erythroxylum novogranatense TaxID=1862640 RepID=A0AAV8SUL4_9ROSI|nr:hypothetical protein K2173_022205 [Erythroxylum novogranatense]